MSSVGPHMVIEYNGASYRVGAASWVDISLPVTERPTVRAFHLPPATFTPFRAGDFVGSIEQGGPVRCDIVSVAPHGDGTHTECVGHVGGKDFSVLNAVREPLMIAQVITVPLHRRDDGDLVVRREDLASAWPDVVTHALIIRTLPNADAKRVVDHSGSNPAYVDVEAMSLIVDRGVMHLMIDLPSVDREEDAGLMAAHKLFWNWPAAPRTDKTITELIYVPNTVADGLYALAMNVAPFDGDAAPSRPMIAPLTQR